MPKYTKRADGRYATSIVVGKEGNKTKRKFLYGSTIRELEEKVADFKSLQNKGVVVDDNGMLLKDWAVIWLELYKSQKSYNTYAMYKNAVEKHIIPNIGDVRLKLLKKHNLQELLNALIAQGHYRSAEVVKLTLTQIISAAIDEQYIFVDITRGLSLPKKPYKEKRALTEAEYDRLQKADLSSKQRLFVDILLYTGLRRGEALAINRNSIDLDNNYISVLNVVIFKGNTPVIKEIPKSDSSVRKIPIPDKLRESLMLNMPLCGEDYLFTMEKTDGLLTKSAYGKFWNSIAKKSDLPDDVTAHILRHNYTTKLYYAGVDAKTAQKLLGHSSVQITLDIYTHLSNDMSDAVDKINNMF